MCGPDAGPVLDRHPVITPRCGVLRRLYVLWTLTQTVAGATGLRTSENTVMASLTSASAASHSASTYGFARKRSYKRAVRRAAQSEGQHTQYRGRVCTLQQLCRGYRGRKPQPGPSRRFTTALSAARPGSTACANLECEWPDASVVAGTPAYS